MDDVAAWQRTATAAEWQERDARIEAFRRFAMQVAARCELYATIYALPAGSEVEERTTQIIADAIEDRLRTRATPLAGIDIDLTAAGLAASYTELLRIRLQERPALTAEQIANHLADLMPAWALDAGVSATR